MTGGGSSKLGAGIAIGIGVAVDNLALGIGCGVAIGAGIGSALQAAENRKNQDEADEPPKDG